MTRPEETNVYDERSHNRPSGMERFFVNKNCFETSLDYIALSDAERERLKKALEFAFIAGQETVRSVIVEGDDYNAKRMQRFYDGIVMRVETGSYIAEICHKQKPETD